MLRADRERLDSDPAALALDDVRSSPRWPPNSCFRGRANALRPRTSRRLRASDKAGHRIEATESARGALTFARGPEGRALRSARTDRWSWVRRAGPQQTGSGVRDCRAAEHRNLRRHRRRAAWSSRALRGDFVGGSEGVVVIGRKGRCSWSHAEPHQDADGRDENRRRRN
jgi:hypothetical protein